MNRIKFKAYISQLDKLINVNTLAILDKNRYLIDNSFICVEEDLFQYTKVGDIYEGSIVKTYDDSGDYIGIVYQSKYEEAGFSLYRIFSAETPEEYSEKLKSYEPLIREFRKKVFYEYETLYVSSKRYTELGHIGILGDFQKVFD
jgi:hypothetical protein